MNQETLQILLVEDNAGDARLVREMINEMQLAAEVEHVLELAAIMPKIKEKSFDLVLLDLHLPDSSGLNTVLKIQEMMPDVPVIVLTGFDNEELSLASIQAGAQDYLVKGQIDHKQLQKTIQYGLRRYQTLKKINEISTTQKAYLATHDVLTGWPNQQLFLEQLQLMINKNDVTKKTFALIVIEINEINKIIATFGHLEKDTVIQIIAGNLTKSLDKNIFSARYSENRFTLLLSDLPDTLIINDYVTKIQEALTKNILIVNKDYFPSYNIGVAVFPHDGDDVEILIKNAQTALQQAAKRGIRQFEIYTKKLATTSVKNDELIWHGDLQFALERQEFFIVYQPKVDIASHEVKGVEALLRWQHPKLGLVSPTQFIPVAEDSNLIVDIGNWLLEEAAKQYQTWQNQTEKFLPLRISVNVSVCQLQHNNLIDIIQQVLHKYQMPPECLEIELTESIFIVQPEAVIEKLNQLKKLNIYSAIDDFGKGYSSLSYLSHLPINYLKLDMDFVQNNHKDQASKTIVQSIIDLAHSLNLIVTAEGVETQEQYELLKKQQCDEIQGFYFSKPVQPNYISNIIMNNFIVTPGRS